MKTFRRAAPSARSTECPSVPFGLTLLLLLTLTIPIRADDEPVRPLRSEGRSRYVHRLTLYDHDGQVITPEDVPVQPYSPRATCGKCHPYGQIAHGWHFNADEADVPPGRPGEPWLYVDEQLGVVLPLTERDWPGAFSPLTVGLSHWEFTKQFGRHLPGDALSAPEQATIDESDKWQRWNISGVVEIDCLLCHSADNYHDPAEIARQLEAENFKWIPTAAAGLAIIRGEARKMPDDWDPYMPPNPDFPEQNPPQLIYDESRFDADDRVFFDVTRRPDPERCYFCHTVQPAQLDADEPSPRWRHGADVHLAAGMVCTDCHRNDIDHDIIRGYAGEADVRNDPDAAAYSCAGCHLGTEHPSSLATTQPTRTEVARGGRYGAPRPVHAGLPPVHFEKLTCTACHSGPLPEAEPGLQQTSFAHSLGLASRDRRPDDPPHILAPLFAAQADGRIAPHRAVYPQFWGLLEFDQLTPLPIDRVEAQLADVVPDKSADGAPLSDEQIIAGLRALKPSSDRSDARVVYVRDAHVFYLQRDDQLQRRPWREAVYRWPLGHDVRPAAQSLGADGCTDCHAEDAPFFFGRTSVLALSRDDPEPQVMADLQDVDARQAAFLARSFMMRSYFKAFAVACLVVLGAVLVTFLFRGIAVIGTNAARQRS